jgi:hypothetical protein
VKRFILIVRRGSAEGIVGREAEAQTEAIADGFQVLDRPHGRHFNSVPPGERTFAYYAILRAAVVAFRVACGFLCALAAVVLDLGEASIKDGDFSFNCFAVR